MEALIRVVVLDFYGCEPRILQDAALLENMMLKCAKVMGATVIKSSFNNYNPYGVSGVVIIAESHLAIHTWPEYGYAAVTFETCGKKIDPWRALPLLEKSLKAERCSHLEMYRGLFDVPSGSLPHKPPEAVCHMKTDSID